VRHIRQSSTVLLFVVVSALLASPESKTGTLCIIPDAPGCCTRVSGPFDLKTLMFKIDGGEKTRWPEKAVLKIDGLSIEEGHLVVVYSSGKAIQSFKFRFSQYKQSHLCLLFDGYGGPDLRTPDKLCRCS